MSIESARSVRTEVTTRRLPGFLGDHWLIILLLTAGAVVRALVMRAYPPAFWFMADSRLYIAVSGDVKPGGPGAANTIGYPFFLRLFRWTDSFAVVTAVQHLLGLGLGALLYVFLRRRGLPGWLAALGVAPVLLDGRQITLEHYLLGEAVFTVLLTGAILLLLWRERPAWMLCASAGVLVTAAALTRSVGVGICGVLLVYLLVRRVGWKQVVAYGLVVATLLVGYMSWNEAETGKFGLSNAQGRYLYARTAIIADCAKLELTDEQRKLCPPEPLDQRPERADYYLWVSPILHPYGNDQDAFVGTFAKAVITQQFGDYLGSVLKDVSKYLVPGTQAMGPPMTCLSNWWTMPADLRDTGAPDSRCKPLLASGDRFLADPADPRLAPSSPSRELLSDYSRLVRVPAWVLGLSVLLAFAALVWRVRRGRWLDGLDAALLVGVGLAMMVVAVATSMYEPRYGVPSITLMSAGAALAVHRLRSTFSKTPEPVGRKEAEADPAELETV